ncbi:MAG: PaaI family thioesterase [Nitriliruptorales bacterium]|nr:PaaI family thioesterase [Nitriliruptorales bacterium]
MQDLLEAWRNGEQVPPVAKLVGAEFVDYGEGTGRMQLDVDERHHNAMGTLHGGMLCDLADMTMGIALASVLDGDEGFTTLNLNADYLRPVRAGVVTASAEVVRRGGRTALLHCRLEHDGALVAHVASNCLLFGKE